MKKLFTLSVALLALMVGSALAGDYHSGATLLCADCHVMHSSQSHGYSSDGSGTFTPVGQTTGHEYLLRNDINPLCLSCHDGSNSAPDVLAANGGILPTNGRLAGALNRDNTAPYYDATGHTLGSVATAPGGTFTDANGLNCVDCHQPHGRTVTDTVVVGGVTSTVKTQIYRNLNVWINGTPSKSFMNYAVGTNDLTKDVYEINNGGADHYDIQNVNFNEPDPTGSAYGTYCKQCHTNFHGSSTDANMNDGSAWLRHPTADADLAGSMLTRYKGLSYRVKMMTSANDWGPWGAAWATPPADLTPTCFTCHKSHGNQNAFGLIYATGAANYGENGDGTSYKNLCNQCHPFGL
jgi:hypothetical protein